MGAFIGRERELARLRRALDEGVDAIVVGGQVGVGKTRLARELVEGRSGAGEWVTATRATGRVPFGAFAELVGEDQGEVASRTETLQRVMVSLRDRTDGDRLVLVVDDAPQLDETSAALLSLVAAAHDMTLVVTYRTDEPHGDLLSWVGATGAVEHLELAPLGRDATRDLANSLVGCPLIGRSFDELWDRTRGNPLFVRELLLEARERGALVERDGLAVLEEVPEPSTLLREIVGARLRHLGGAHLDVLERLAVQEPLELALLVADPDRELSLLEDLEEQDLVTVRVERRRRLVALGHPLYGEVLRADMPRTRWERHAREIAERLEATGVRRRDDALALADLTEVAGTELDPDRLLAAARRALELFEHDRAVQFARRAQESGGGVEADVVLGEALTNLGRVEEAESVLSAIPMDAGDPVLSRAALIRARNLLFESGQGQAAQTIVEEALEVVTESTWRDELEAFLALCLGASGDFEAASAAGRRMVERDGASDRSTLSVLVISTLADALMGRLEDATTGVQRGLALVPHLRDELPFAELQLTVNQLMVAWHGGKLVEAEHLGRERMTQAAEAGAADPAALYGLFLGMVLLERGRCRQSLDVCLTALDRAQDRSVFGIETSGLAIAARARAGLGDVDGAASTLDELAEFEGDMRARIHGSRAEAWAMVARGAMTEAAEFAAERGRWTLSTSHLVWGASTLYDAVRFGRPELVVDDLTAVADEVEGGLVDSFRDHAVHRCAADGEGLDDVARRFRAMGADGYAAEAASHAVETHRRAGRGDLARRSEAVVALALRGCEGEGFPIIAPPSLEPLSPREEEVARMAAAGLTSREIAKDLVISVRTVDNHLASVYRKAGVAGRDELPALFGALPGTGD